MASVPNKILISSQQDDVRLDNFLSKEFLLPKNLIYKEIRKGNIKVNKKKKKYSYRLKSNDEISIYGNYEFDIIEQKPLPKSYIKKFNDAIIFKDQNYIVINKWAGISSQSGTKVDISIDDIASQISFDNKKLHLVHRLDKDTSGLLILALDIKTSRFFLDMFSNQKIKKTYFAIVQNKEEMKIRGTINIPIYDKEKKLEAKTNYKLEKKISNSLSYVKLNPKTGRKHQLRIHCSESNFPILGDKKYFHKDIRSKLREKKLFLHAGEIEFIGPNKKLVKYSADLPDHFQKYLEKIS